MGSREWGIGNWAQEVEGKQEGYTEEEFFSCSLLPYSLPPTPYSLSLKLKMLC
jgi:hypothetical protein